MGEMALRLGAGKLSQPLRISGFLDQRSISDHKLALHVVKVESVERGEQQTR